MPRAKKVPTSPPKPQRRRRGTGSIQQLADGSFRARLPSAVNPKRTSREFSTLELAEAWLDSHLNPAPAIDAPAPTVRNWTGSWWQTFVEPIHPPNTARWYLYALRKLESLYGTLVPDVRRSSLQAIASSMSADLDPATLQGIVGVWRRCFDVAVDDELIERNPARRIAVPKAPPRKKRRFVSSEEAALLRVKIVNHRFEACYALLLGCGLRIGEVLGLAWSDVDLGRRRAWIQQQWTNSHWRQLPKGRNPHWVRLPDMVMAALIRHRDRQPAGAVLVMQSPFNRPGRGKRRPRRTTPHPWSAQTVGKDLRLIVDDLDLDHLTPHAARRGLVTALLDGGVSPATIAEMVGHSDPSITLRAYSQASDQGRELAAELVDRYLNGGADGDDSGTSTAS